MPARTEALAGHLRFVRTQESESTAKSNILKSAGRRVKCAVYNITAVRSTLGIVSILCRRLAAQPCLLHAIISNLYITSGTLTQMGIFWKLLAPPPRTEKKKHAKPFNENKCSEVFERSLQNEIKHAPKCFIIKSICQMQKTFCNQVKVPVQTLGAGPDTLSRDAPQGSPYSDLPAIFPPHHLSDPLHSNGDMCWDVVSYYPEKTYTLFQIGSLFKMTKYCRRNCNQKQPSKCLIIQFSSLGWQ